MSTFQAGLGTSLGRTRPACPHRGDWLSVPVQIGQRARDGRARSARGGQGGLSVPKPSCGASGSVKYLT